MVAGEEIVEPGEQSGAFWVGCIVRAVSASYRGTGCVVLFEGRDDGDGWPARKGSPVKVRRR
mgnify:CR=1 FL=1